MKTWIKSNYGTIVLVFASFLFGMVIDHYYDLHMNHRDDNLVQLRENSPEYKFINPLILVSENRKIVYEKYANLKDSVEKIIENAEKDGKAFDISFYFRDLNNGEWIGVNEDEKYAPASMLKVSTLVAILKLASKDPSVLLEKVNYKPTNMLHQSYQPNQMLLGTYSVKDLLQQMIIESDNDAMHALNELYATEVVKIYDDLDLPDFFSDELDFMSPRLFSRFFRVLYNSSYLSDFYSDEALGLLASTKFDKGLVAGVSSGTVVAHKFGEFTDASQSIKRELHDCGIVYYPEKPYFICVMTAGTEFASLEGIISNLSKVTFDYVESHD